MDPGLEIAIQILVGIQLRRIRGEVEDLDFLLVLFEPRLDNFRVMDAQVIKNQEYLPPSRSTDQPFQEFDQSLCIESPVVEHPTDQTLIRDRGNHVDARILRGQPDHRGLSFWRITASVLAVAAYSGLISPVNLRMFRFGSILNRWIFLFEPTPNRFGALLIGAFEWFLRCETPAVQIMPDRANRHRDPETNANQLRNSLPCPQGETELALVRRLVDDRSLDFTLLLRGERAIHSLLDSPASRFYGRRAELVVLSTPYRNTVSVDLENLGDFRVLLPTVAKAYRTSAQLLLRLRCECAGILFFHAQIYDILAQNASIIMAGLIIINRVY